MKGLIAKRPILYRGRMYKAGENLPGDDAKMVAAWLENDSAELCGEAKSADRGGQEAAQEPENAPEVSEDQGAGNEAQGGQEPPQEGGTEDGGMIAGHLDPAPGPQGPGGPEKGRPGAHGHGHGPGYFQGQDQGGPDRRDHGGGSLRPRRE